MYLQLLGDPYFQVSALESILSWLQDETARVEDELLRHAQAIDALTKCFVNSKANSFENLLDPFLKVIRLSTPLTLAISKSSSFFKRIVDRLQGGGKAKAVVRLNLLKILRGVCDVHPNKAMLVERYGLLSVVERLSRDGGDGGAVLVRELAREIVPALKPALRPSSAGASLNGHPPMQTPSRSRSTGAAGLMDLGRGTLIHSLSNSTSTSTSTSQMSHASNEREGSSGNQRERKAWAPKRLRRATSEATGTSINNQNLSNSTSARAVSDLQVPTKSGLGGRQNKSGTGIVTSSPRQRLGDILWQSADDNSSGNMSDKVGGRWI